MKIPFSPPALDEETVANVTKVLLSGWITTGPETKAFEKELTSFCGNKATIAVNSATAGLELMLRWYGVGPGDEVIVPAYTYCATANVVLHTGAKPIIVDVGNDFNIDIAEIRNAINENTKVIMPVDIAGWPCDYDELNALVNDKEIKAKFKASNENQSILNRILVLGDSAHSVGAKYQNQRAGSLCDVSVFSFHAVKNLTTAEGGAIALNLPDGFDNQEVYRYLNKMSLHGQSKDALEKTKQGSWQYDIEFPGYKCNMTDIQATIGRLELKKYEKTLARRKSIIEHYRKGFANFPWAILPPFDHGMKQSAYHLFLLRIEGFDEGKRNELIQRMADDGIATNVHFQPLPLLTCYSSRGYKMEDFPGAYKQFHNEITLPVYTSLADENVQLIIDTLISHVDQML